MSYTLHLENLLHSPILETPLVGSNFLKIFIHPFLASLYLFDFFFRFFNDLKIDRFFIVLVSAHCRLSC